MDGNISIVNDFYFITLNLIILIYGVVSILCKLYELSPNLTMSHYRNLSLSNNLSGLTPIALNIYIFGDYYAPLFECFGLYRMSFEVYISLYPLIIEYFYNIQLSIT